MQQNNLISYISKINKIEMFNLCKTVKIYQTFNHFHQKTSFNSSKQLHQLQFIQQLKPLSQNTSINSRPNSSSPTKHKNKRHGIQISLKKSFIEPSPPKKSTSSYYHSQSSNRTIENKNQKIDQRMVKTLRHNEIYFNYVGNRDFNASRINQPKIYSQFLYERRSLPQQDIFNLPEISLKKINTDSTNVRNSSNLYKTQDLQKTNKYNPLKRSTNFLRTSKANLIDSNIEINLQNSILINEKYHPSPRNKIQQNSEQMIRLSCSSCSIDQKIVQEQRSHTCSLQLKNQQSFLNQFAYQVSKSIIINQQNPQVSLLSGKSNIIYSNNYKTQRINYSHISKMDVQHCISPVQRLKRRYGQNLLNISDKQTIKSVISRSALQQIPHEIIDQSLLIQHEVLNRFIPIQHTTTACEEFRMFLGVQNVTNLLVLIKQLPATKIQKINSQIYLYKQISNMQTSVSICHLYQHYINGQIFVLIKQPYQITLLDHIKNNKQKYCEVDWKFTIMAILQAVKNTISTMKKYNIYLSRPITASDLVYRLGDWGFHSPNMFSKQSSNLSEDIALNLLRQQLCGRINNYP